MTTNQGTNWTTVAHSSNYLTVLDGHPLPAVAFGAPTTVTAVFTLNTPQANINGIRIIGSEGGTASAGFIGVFELATKVQSAPKALQINNVSVSSGEIRFDFLSESGSTYLVEYKASLNDSNWQTLTTIQGDGTVKTVNDRANAASRFYRVRTQ